MIAIAFANDAFNANIKSLEEIFKLQVKKPRHSLQLKWKKSILKTPIFRQAVPSADWVRTSHTIASHYYNYLYYLQRLGLEVGFPQILAPYGIRRGSGEAVDGKFFRHLLCTCSY
jgi:hypothetical protein